MFIIQGISNAVSWMSEPLSTAWQSAEPLVIVGYLIALLVVALWVWRQQGSGARILAGAIFVLLAGEAYRLVPRVVTAISPKSPLPNADGLGQILSFLCTAGFFLILEIYRQQHIGKDETETGHRMESGIVVLFGVIIAVSFVRFNNWMDGNTPIFWLIVRNMLLAGMGVLSILLWIRTSGNDRSLRHVPTAIALTLVFYLPYAVFGDLMPELSILMIPRTITLIWLIWILRGSAVLRGTGYSFKTYIKRYWTLYLLLFLPIVFFALFRYYPMSYISLAFKQNNIRMHPWEVPLAGNGGMEWFINIFNQKEFKDALSTTIVLNLLDLVIGMPMPIIMALLLNELAFPKYKRLTQTILYLPHFLSWVIISSISLRLFADSDGIINKIFGTSVPFLSEGNHWRGMYIVLGIWKECGWNTIIYLAALTGINAELYEAAEVDGAGRFQKIWHVTLPGIRSTIIVLLIMNLGRILGSEFDRPYTLATKMAGSQFTETISIFVYEHGINADPQQFSLSTAVGLFQSVVCVIFLVASNTLAKKFGERGIW